MEISEIQGRMDKLSTKIEKIQKRINKWEAAKSDAGFKKQYDWNSRDGKWYNYATGEYDLSFDEYKSLRWDDYEKDCDREKRYAETDLANAQLTMKKYENALEAAQVKQEKLDAPRIKVIMDFLEDWKQKSFEYFKRNAVICAKYAKLDNDACDWHNSKWLIIKNQGITEDEWKAKYKEMREEEGRLRQLIHPITREVYSRKSEDHINHEKLQAILDKTAEEMYLDLIERVTKITGKIQDSSNLKVGVKGDLEGTIIGEEGKARVQTIDAGGWNIQRYHFRTLVHAVK